MGTAATSFRTRLLPVLALCVSLLAQTPVAAELEDEQVLRIGGHSATLHKYDMEQYDAAVRFRHSLIQAMSGTVRSGTPVQVEVELFDHFSEMRERFASGSLDALFCDTMDYLSIEKHAHKDHVYMLSRDGDTAISYSMVTRRRHARTLKRLADLQGRDLTLGIGNTTANRLINAQLKREGFSGDRFRLRKVTRVSNNQAAIINLMFGKTDAVLVPTTALKRAAAANPQVPAALHTLFVSDPLIPGVLVVHKALGADRLGMVERRFKRLHESRAGRDLLDLFQARRVLPISADSLTQARAVFNR